MRGRVRAMATGLVLTGIGLLMLTPIEDPDLWWLLASGRYMVQTRSFPTVDPFSSTALGAPWVNHAWGFELILYGVHALGGTTGLILLQALFAVATFAVLHGVLRREGLRQGWALFLIALGAVATRGFWYPRPQLVTYLMLALFWAMLREARVEGGDHLGWLPALTVLWVNLHGGFLIGPVLVGLCLVATLLDRVLGGGPPGVTRPGPGRLSLVLAGTALAALVNPFHYHALLFPVQVMGDTFAQSYISEWGPLPFQHPHVALLEGLVVLLLVLLLVTPRSIGGGELVPLLAFIHLGLQAVRSTPLLVIVLLPILGRVLADVRRAPRIQAAGFRAWLSVPALVLAVTVAGVALAGVRSLAEYGPGDLRPRFGVADVFPASAVEFLRQHPQSGPLFNEYIWGGYLVWRLYPDYRVSIDGRAAVYGPQRFAEHVTVVDLHPGWRETLDQSGAGIALIRAGSPLAVVLKASPGWEVLHEDRLAALLRRRGGAS